MNNLTATNDYPDESLLSPNNCPFCYGPMTIGEEQAGGICSECYFAALATIDGDDR